VILAALAAAVIFPQTSYAARKASCFFLFNIGQIFPHGSTRGLFLSNFPAVVKPAAEQEVDSSLPQAWTRVPTSDSVRFDVERHRIVPLPAN
jgi:hypothetical protein